ncbi:fungal-specific transcription factor domain-containing protein [Lasiosphaeris hirsuta]|uniref:Fungal-specific transcription factor domain-containing protein n=1 Tax=Lasiosphaeris hirsuta TaxID=260670 RepID=A0AA40AG14_9PEZI|nr:fungal-specific transcription factor domain-containing protein [Lasiosphaeris hirsuta]
MDAAFVFRQGLGSVVPRPPQNFFPRKPPVPTPHPVDDADSDAPHRIAHTLTACCRCRQRKTRCDPALPRCLPCERSGSICEYFDTTKGRKINRSYVVKLQAAVRKLEAELAQYTDEEIDDPHNHEAMVRPGGMVRLGETDETPRYLGPSSGIAMTRLLMEEAKRYTEKTRIADLIPEVHARRQDRFDRMQSVVSMVGSIGGSSGRKKSYAMTAEVPNSGLPSRAIADKLVDVFNQRAQVFTPTLHEMSFAQDLDAVFDNDTDPYKNFIVRMVLAISLQKMDPLWAGLADSYYLAAMQYIEDVVRPKDLKTLQCLVLIGQYSLLTPTRTAVYYVVGLATRICQQLGLSEEKTIALGSSDPLNLDMRRRLSWIVTTNEFGLAHSMGRPNGFAKGDDFMDVQFFEAAKDEDITLEGIRPGPVCEKKMVCIHFCKMRLLQAEIRRMLYEKKRADPSHESHPWFAQMERKLESWRDASPEQPEWCKPWYVYISTSKFTGRYHSMIVFLYRPSPQVPNPSSAAALKCFDGANYIINLSSQQVMKSAVDITWVFLMTLYMSLNTVLWSLSYSEVRAKHPREEVEELVKVAVDIIDQCSARWPGSDSAAKLYSAFAEACMHSYELKEESPAPTGNNALNTPPSQADPSSPDSDANPTGPPSQQAQSQPSLFNTSPFGYVFNATAEEMSAQYSFDSGPNAFQSHPTFRSNSIFFNPSTDANGRRFSYFAPDYTHSNEAPLPERTDDATPPGTAVPRNGLTPSTANSLPTPPESLAPPSADPNNNRNHSLSPRLTGIRSASPTPTPTMPRASPAPMSLQASPLPPPGPKYGPSDYPHHNFKQQPGMPPPRTPLFTIPPPQHPTHHRATPVTVTHHRAVPAVVTDWFSPPPPFSSQNPTSWGSHGYWPDDTSTMSSSFPGLGLSNDSYVASGRRGVGGPGQSAENDFGVFAGSGFPQYMYPQERQGSLSHDQQMELSSLLEADGGQEIDSFLSAGMGLGGHGTDWRGWA